MTAPATRHAWQRDLTSREIEVCELVVQGYGNKWIGARLGLSARTVEEYRASAMRKLEVDNAVKLTRKVLGVDL